MYIFKAFVIIELDDNHFLCKLSIRTQKQAGLFKYEKMNFVFHSLNFLLKYKINLQEKKFLISINIYE